MRIIIDTHPEHIVSLRSFDTLNPALGKLLVCGLAISVSWSSTVCSVNTLTTSTHVLLACRMSAVHDTNSEYITAVL